MRFDPADKIIREKEIKEALQVKTDKITRVVAIVVAFLSTFMFFVKILFF